MASLYVVLIIFVVTLMVVVFFRTIRTLGHGELQFFSLEKALLLTTNRFAALCSLDTNT